ncbi:MAG: uracil-DNA glycosylase, partial [Candidatus Eisenbacteria bacterium]|nr:uracil-DNA glycosylase [Candidatus Eisenbacteria bacterium]
LRDCYITNVVRCAPPGNKPAPIERERCAGFLRQELALLRRARVFVALGRIAFEDLWRQIGDEGRRPDFTHGAEHALSDLRSVLLCSYHPSRQNTQTGRLTAPMFDAIFARAQQILAGTSLGTSMPISLPERD